MTQSRPCSQAVAETDLCQAMGSGCVSQAHAVVRPAGPQVEEEERAAPEHVVKSL